MRTLDGRGAPGGVRVGLAAGAVSALLALLAGWLVLRGLTGGSSGEGDTVQLVDTGAELGAVLEAGAGAGPVRTIPEEVARLLFPALVQDAGRCEYHPDVLLRRRGPNEVRVTFLEHASGGWTQRTSAAGFRGPAEPREERPDLRVIVAGDSHVEGVVPFEETASALLEDELRTRLALDVEVLNGAVGGHTFVNYAGLLEASRELAPHVFVAVVYGGNDFGTLVHVMHHLKGLGAIQEPPGYGWARDEAAKNSVKGFAQATNQVGFFAHHPEERSVAVDGAVELTLEMQRVCRERGTELVMAYLPSILDAQPATAGPDIEHHLKLFRLFEDDPDRQGTDRLADAWMERVRAEGVRVVDLRPAFRAAPERLFWKTDYHLNTAGHRLLAEGLVPEVRSAAGAE